MLRGRWRTGRKREGTEEVRYIVLNDHAPSRTPNPVIHCVCLNTDIPARIKDRPLATSQNVYLERTFTPVVPCGS